MHSPSLLLVILSILAHVKAITPVSVSSTTPSNAPPPVLDAFLSYSLEFAFFPDYAGNTSSPNAYSNNLLNNIGNFTGTKPNLRIGGNTQDYAIFNATLPTATLGIIDPAISVDYPTTLFIGPSFFESYSSFPDTKFSHGFNLGLGSNASHTTEGLTTLLATIPLACQALSGGKVFSWEYGNEPDLYSTRTATANGTFRGSDWNESLYVEQWLNGSKIILAGVKEACPELADVEFMAPSFAGTGNTLNPLKTWEDGLDMLGDINLISSHNYIDGATSPGVTLQATLMNHTRIVESISTQVSAATSIRNFLTTETNLTTFPPYILGETNSLFNEGAPGLSNAFGAALWGVDFALYLASVGIGRVHFHQGTNFRYQSWQPVNTNDTVIGTKAPYYGNIFSAAAVEGGEVQIVGLPLSEDTESAYAAYMGGKLTRIVVVNLNEYNYTINGTGPGLNPIPRPSTTYSFEVGNFHGAVVRRLTANGSDAITGITFDAVSYNWDLDMGKPVVLDNVTRGETAVLKNGVVSVDLLDSSAVILDLLPGTMEG